MNRFPKLETPPLDEVVCGFSFASVPEFSALRLGIYWNDRRAEFPTTSTHPPVMDAPQAITLGTLPQRVWMESEDGSLLLQMQHNRFYVNWRARGATYPRFTTRGENEGLLAIALREFSGFSDFVEAELKVRPVLSGCEVTKIDVLREGEHWDGIDDLRRLAPVLEAFAGFGLADDVADFDHRVQVVGPPTRATRFWSQFRQDPRAVRLETRVVGQLAPEAEIEAGFAELNDAANETFFSVIRKDELYRFNTQKEKE